MSELTSEQSDKISKTIEFLTGAMVHDAVLTVKIMVPEASLRTSNSESDDEIDYREHIAGRVDYINVYDGSGVGWLLQIRFRGGMGTTLRAEHLNQVIFQVHTPPRSTRITGEN